MTNLINWVDKRANWNLQPRYWETEIGSKNLKVALAAIAVSALVFATVAVASFSAGILVGSVAIACISTVAHYALAQNEHYWKDPNYCQKRCEEAVNAILDLPNMGMRKHTIDKVKTNFEELVTRKMLSDDDFEAMRTWMVLQYLKESWTSFEAFLEASSFNTIADVPEEARSLLKQKWLKQASFSLSDQEAFFS